jgi:hypothetical protein
VIVGADDSTFSIFGISVFLIYFPMQFLKDEFGFFLVGKFGEDTKNPANLFASSGVACNQFPPSRMHTSRMLQYTILAGRLAATCLRMLSLKFALGPFAQSIPRDPSRQVSKRLFTVSAKSLNPIDDIPFFDVFCTQPSK